MTEEVKSAEVCKKDVESSTDYSDYFSESCMETTKKLTFDEQLSLMDTVTSLMDIQSDHMMCSEGPPCQEDRIAHFESSSARMEIYKHLWQYVLNVFICEFFQLRILGQVIVIRNRAEVCLPQTVIYCFYALFCIAGNIVYYYYNKQSETTYKELNEDNFGLIRYYVYVPLLYDML